jgi:adenine-specific DNA methylase
MGQKSRFVRCFKDALKHFDSATVFVDLFGGSGLLSHVAKRERPDARVIYNDYDNFRERIENAGRTNALLADLRDIIGSVPQEKRLDTSLRETVLARVKEEDERGFVDYITLSSSLLFSMRYATNFDELRAITMYNNVRIATYNCDGYLDGLEIVKHDYKELHEQYKDRKGAVFFVDPPYLSTEVGVYKCYWKLADYLDVLRVLDGTSYILFTSNKSSLVELMAWISERFHVTNPLMTRYEKKHETM